MRTPLIPDFVHHKFQAREEDFKKYFGLAPEKKWPAEGMDPIDINGVRVLVLPLGFAKKFPRGRKPHRLVAYCPSCGKMVGAGRLQQHYKIHLKEEQS